jgi:hypothetical protein
MHIWEGVEHGEAPGDVLTHLLTLAVAAMHLYIQGCQLSCLVAVIWWQRTQLGPATPGDPLQVVRERGCAGRCIC